MNSDLENELKAVIQGEVRFDEISRQVYSVDASIYEIEPLGIILPKSKDDLIKAVNVARRYGIPVIPRGAATGITGGCLGKGLVIDTSKYLNRILHIDYKKQTATCEPGVIQDVLNAALSEQGYRLGPDTSTGNRATIGGMLANNAAGARSLRYGKMVDHVHSVEILLSSGELMHLSTIDEQTFNSSKERVYQAIRQIRTRYGEDIETHFPKIPRRVSGYNLDEIVKPFPLNLSKLVAGSEGTLGICTEITMHISKKPQKSALSLLYFDDLTYAMEQIPFLLTYCPLSLELIDQHIIQAARQAASFKTADTSWLPQNAQIIVFAEFDAANMTELREKIEKFQTDFTKSKIRANIHTLLDSKQMQGVWELRKAGLGLLLSKRSYSRAIAFIEDIAVPPKNLPRFMLKLTSYLKSQNKEAGIYGHVGAGCIHVRPYIDLRNAQDLHLMEKIIKDVSTIVLEEGGAMSGEHGDGLVRSWLNEKMFGESIIHAFEELKIAFDPTLTMNPGKIVFPSPFLENLRLNPQTQTTQFETFFDFSKQGGFELAVDLCNGNGRCRKGEGIMCPSFQATQDEYDSTRARAQALRTLIHQKLKPTDLANEGIRDILDLCLECKGCKTECPSEIDMAKMKAETSYHYHKKHGLSLRSRAFGMIGELNQTLFHFNKLFNLIIETKWFKSLQSWLGIAPQRTLPRLNNQRFSSWFAQYTQPKNFKKQVVLFNDTFTEFNALQIGQSAIKVLNALGYFVILPEWKCCGRPAISKGMLEQAQSKANLLIEQLYSYAQQELPIIGLEPSCILTIKDDFADLTRNPKMELIAKSCQSFDEFIAHNLEHFPPSKGQGLVKVHVHCHQKALIGVQPTLKILKNLPEYEIELIQDGCCGMAGSFGYEKEHYDLSMKIGNLHLFPAIQQSADHQIVIANGISCRTQIIQGTQKHPLHLAEFLASIWV